MKFSGTLQGVAVATLVALALTACSGSSSAAGQAPAPAANPDQVVAEVAGRKVTLKEVDAKWEEFDAAERARVTQLMYQNRRNMLDQVVGEILIENAAKAAGSPVEAYLAQDAAKRAAPVTEQEVAQFFEANRDRAQGRTIEQLGPQIREFLASQRVQQARAQLVEELKAKSTGVKVMLDPPRYTVATTAADPVRGVASAPVTIIEFSDYQCPFCARVNPTLDLVRKTYGDKVKIVFKDFPLPNHPQAPKASEAAHCAGERPDVRQSARAERAGAEAVCDRAGHGRDEVQPVPRLGQARRPGGVGIGAGREDGRELDADSLHQRPRVDWRAAVRGVQADHRRRARPQVALRNQDDLALRAGFHHRGVRLGGIGQRQLAADDGIERAAFESGDDGLVRAADLVGRNAPQRQAVDGAIL
jgi:protein-disulfide isomerase